MRTSDRSGGGDGPSIYAPKWARKTVESEPRVTLFRINARNPGKRPADPHAEREVSPRDRSPVGRQADAPNPKPATPPSGRREDLYVDQLLPNLPPPGILESIAMRSNGARRRFWPTSLVIASLIAAVFAIGGIPYPRWSSTTSDQAGAAISGATGPFQGAPAMPTASIPPAAQLIVAPPMSGTTNEALPLGLSLAGEPSGVALMFGGLAAGTELSGGAPSGTDGWRLSAKELDQVKIWPPKDFSGSMNVTVDLRLADGTIGDHQVLHFEWNPAPVTNEQVAVSQPVTTTINAPPTPPPMGADFQSLHAPSEATEPQAYQLDHAEITRLIERGEMFIATKDIASARLVFRRAAAANDPQAALMLGNTYDPIVLEKLGVPASFANVEMARSWYEKAKDSGSTPAAIRLRTLTDKDR